MSCSVTTEVLEVVLDVKAQAEEDIVPNEQLAAVVIGRVDGRDASVYHSLGPTDGHLDKVKLRLEITNNQSLYRPSTSTSQHAARDQGGGIKVTRISERSLWLISCGVFCGKSRKVCSSSFQSRHWKGITSSYPFEQNNSDWGKAVTETNTVTANKMKN